MLKMVCIVIVAPALILLIVSLIRLRIMSVHEGTFGRVTSMVVVGIVNTEVLFKLPSVMISLDPEEFGFCWFKEDVGFLVFVVF